MVQTEKVKLLSCQIQMNMLFKNNDERKRRGCDKIYITTAVLLVL